MSVSTVTLDARQIPMPASQGPASVEMGKLRTNRLDQPIATLWFRPAYEVATFTLYRFTIEREGASILAPPKGELPKRSCNRVRRS